MTDPGLERAIAHAIRLGLDVEPRPAKAYDDLSGAAEELGIDLTDVVKTMVLRSGDTFLIALVPGGFTLSWPKVRAALGVNRVTIANGNEAAAHTGYPKGGISILGLDDDMTILADKRLRGRRIAIRAGTRTHSLLVDADDLFGALRADVRDLCDVRVG